MLTVGALVDAFAAPAPVEALCLASLRCRSLQRSLVVQRVGHAADIV